MTKPINIPKDFAEQLPNTIAELQKKQAYYSKLEKAADEVKAAAEKYTQILEQWEENIWELKTNNNNSQTIYNSQKEDSLDEENNENDEKNDNLNENDYSQEEDSLNEENNENDEENNNLNENNQK